MFSVTQNYGNKNPDYALGYHTGVDLDIRDNNVRAFVGGKVIDAGYDKNYGNRVYIQDGSGLYHLYAHLKNIAVSEGQKVNAGQLIGQEGSTGNSTGSHLHYEIRKEKIDQGSNLDPGLYLSGIAGNGGSFENAAGQAAYAEGQKANQTAADRISGTAAEAAFLASLADEGGAANILLRVILLVFGMLFLFLGIKNAFLGGGK